MKTASWRQIASEAEAAELIDMGILLSWKDMRTINKALTKEQKLATIRHFALRLSERIGHRLPEEILIESLLVWLANSEKEDFVTEFIGEIVVQQNMEESCFTLVELALTTELSDHAHNHEIYAMAVALICELGITVYNIEEQYPGEIPLAKKLLEHITTYLLSVSNSDNSCIRLSLVNYFGYTERLHPEKPGFNRIMGRFGHTVLEQLFQLLFEKKTEAIALQFLLDNFPYFLNGDNHSQRIVHETCKFYMLKKPERFALFVQTVSGHVRQLDQSAWAEAKVTFLQHLFMLLKIVSDVNHKELGREIMQALSTFEDQPLRNPMVEEFIANHRLREPYKRLLSKLCLEEKKTTNIQSIIDDVAIFRTNRRGRKPSFARVDKLGTIAQVFSLSGGQNARAAS